MKTGTMLLAHCSKDCGLSVLTTRCAAELERRGHGKVYPAFYGGTPSPVDVLREMSHGGIDTVAVIPMTVAEGRLTVELMPKAIGMPDNSCSYTYIDGKDISIRFMTALSSDPGMLALAVSHSVGCGIGKDFGIIVASRGSQLAPNRRAAERLAEMFRSEGFVHVATVDCRTDRGPQKALETLSRTCDTVAVVPLFMADGHSMDVLRGQLGLEEGTVRGTVDRNGRSVGIVITEPFTRSPEFVDLLEKKIPW